MNVDSLTVEARERVMVRDCKGRRVAWLSPGGAEASVIRAEVFEVPQVDYEVALSLGLGDTPTQVAERVAELSGTETVRLVLWPNALGVAALHPRDNV